jgi:ATP-dependent helicase HrpA
MDARKDAEKAALIEIYQVEFEQLAAEEHTPERRVLFEDLRWMMEEYRVSVFAQELGTAQPISPKRLLKKLEDIRRIR